MLRNQRSAPSDTSGVEEEAETEATEDTLSELRGHIPDHG